MKQFLLPDPGEGLVEADIVSWHVKPGDEVKINDVLVEVETSKSIVELPSPFAGTVRKLLVDEGDTVDVGAPIILIDDGSPGAPKGDDQEAGDQEAGDQEAGDQEAGDQEAGDQGTGDRVAVLVGYGARTAQTKRRRKRADTSAETHDAVAEAFGTHQPVSHRHDHHEPLEPGPSAPVGPPLPAPGAAAAEPAVTGGSVLAKPPVRKLAKDLGIDLTTITGTGDGGVITREDVQAAAKTPEPVERPTPEPVEGPTPEPVEGPTPEPVEGATPEPVEGGTPEPVEGRQTPPALRQAQRSEDERVPIKGVRKATAQAMVSSAFTAPHVTEWVTFDISATMDLVDKLKARKEFSDLRMTPLVIIARACLLALRRSRSLNATWDEAAQEIVYHGAVHLGIAAATPRGLMVPNIKDADRMGLAELAGNLTELINKARDGKAKPADLSGGTFTITNVGVFGIDAGTPILNPGESGILAVGAIDRRPWVVGSGADERIEPRWVTTLAVSFDHRIVDGEQGSRFLADIAGILGDPATALIY